MQENEYGETMTVQRFAKTMFSNQAIIQFHGIRMWFVVLLFSISIFLSTIPFYVSSFRPTNYEFYYPGITESVYSFLENHSCLISNGKLTCEEKELTVENGPFAVIVTQMDKDDVDKKIGIIYFFTNSMYFDDGHDRIIEGEYTNLGEFDFQEVIRNNKQQGTSKEDFVNVFLKNIELSRVSFHMSTITVSLFLQYLMFTAIIAYLFRFAKVRISKQKVHYGAAVRMIVLSMFSCALISAFASLFMSSMATLIFPFAYVVRVVFLYMRLTRYGITSNSDETLCTNRTQQ